MTCKHDFDAHMLTISADIRDDIEWRALNNSFEVGAYDSYPNDDARWDAAIFTASLMADDPDGFEIQREKPSNPWRSTYCD